MPARSTLGFHQPGRHCLQQALSAVRCSASRRKGELHPSKNRSKDGLRHLVPTFIVLIDDSVNELLYFLVWPLQTQQRASPCNCLMGALPYSHYVIWSFPLCGVRVLHPAQYESCVCGGVRALGYRKRMPVSSAGLGLSEECILRGFPQRFLHRRMRATK